MGADLTALVACLLASPRWNELIRSRKQVIGFLALGIPSPWLHATFLREPGGKRKHAFGKGPVKVWRGYSKLKMNAHSSVICLVHLLRELLVTSEATCRTTQQSWTYALEDMCVHIHSLFHFIFLSREKYKQTRNAHTKCECIQSRLRLLFGSDRSLVGCNAGQGKEDKGGFIDLGKENSKVLLLLCVALHIHQLV